MAGFGETLHQARAHLGVTLKEAEQATRINRHHLAALEEENFAALPPLIYQRGIVRNYAVYLRLEPSRLLESFEDAHGIGTMPQSGGIAAVPPIDMPGHWAPNFAIIAFAVVLSAIVFAWVYSGFVAQPDAESTPPALAPTATPFESDIPLPTQPPATEAPPEEQAPAPTTAAEAADPSTSTRRAGGDNLRGGDDGADDATTGDDVADTDVPNDDSSPPEGGDNQSTDAAANEAAIADEPEPDVEDGMTSIAVTAGAELYVTIVADGEVRFDGLLGEGESTGHIAGFEFEVSTSIGVETIFTNACGDEFTMGNEDGQVTYPLAAGADSCAPITD